MATARLVCGDCGGGISEGDRFCPRCGARVETNPAQQAGEPSHAIRCKVCGRVVGADANFCESCGANLRMSGGPQQKQKPQKKSVGTEQGTKEGRKRRFPFEPWQVITGAVVAVIIAFFAYSELTRDQQAPKPTIQETLPPPTPEMMQEIGQLQKTVDANPTDANSLIRLANMLSDAGMRSPMLLTRAVNAYTRYLALRPADPNARVDMGICFFEMGRIDTNNAASLFSKAIQEMETVINSNPSHQPAAFNLGIVNLNTGNFEEANKWFKKAVEINPNSELGKKAQQMLEQHAVPGQPN